MTGIAAPAHIDTWTVPDESHIPDECLAKDKQLFERIDPTVHYLALQIEDFMQSIRDNRPPFVTGYDGRAVVELFTAIYRSQQHNGAIKFPLKS
jgi:predicted dehydrogenase